MPPLFSLRSLPNILTVSRGFFAVAVLILIAIAHYDDAPAAADIAGEQAASMARLKQLQEDLQVQFDNAISSLLAELAADKAKQEQQAETLNRQADQQIEEQITAMREQHDQHMDAVVDWATKQIVEP